MILGHAHPEVVAAVQAQLTRGSTFFYLHEKAIQLAAAIVDAMPCAEQVRFTSSGTEATFFALRVARAFRGRDKILKFEGAFHGSHDYAMMSTEGQPPTELPRAVRGSAGIPQSLENEVLIAPFNDLDQTTAIIERYHQDLGAVIDTHVVQAMIDYASKVDISPEVGYYIVDLVHASRKDPAVAMGGSPRASIALLRASRCLAASDGREHVYPDDVRAVLRAVMAHRLVLNPDAMLRGDTVDAVLERLTAAVKPPLSARGRHPGSGVSPKPSKAEV